MGEIERQDQTKKKRVNWMRDKGETGREEGRG